MPAGQFSIASQNYDADVLNKTRNNNAVDKPKITDKSTDVETLVNEYRRSKSIDKLKHDDLLCEWATERLEIVSNRAGAVNHNGINEYFKMAWQRDYKVMGETLVMGAYTPEQALRSWQGSPKHNAGMLDTDFNVTCVKCNNAYCVQLFAGK